MKVQTCEKPLLMGRR